MVSGAVERSAGEVGDYQATEDHGGVRGDSLNEKRHSFWRALWISNYGLLMVVVSELFFAFMHLAVKVLNSLDTEPISMAELILVRMAITYACGIGYCVLTGVPDYVLGPKGVRLLLLTRGIGGFIGLYGIYFSLQYLDLSDAVVLTFLAPICTSIAGAVLLGERFTIKQALASLASLLGVVLIARPPMLFGLPENSTGDTATPAQRFLAVVASLVGVLGTTLAFTSLAAIGKRAHPMHCTMAFAGQSVIYSSIVMIVTRTEFVVPTKASWLAMLLMIGIFGVIAQILLTIGLQNETAGRGTMGVYTQIVFATILQKIFLNSTPPPLSILGTLIIMAAAAYTALSKVRAKAEEADPRNVPPPDEEQALLGNSSRP